MIETIDLFLEQVRGRNFIPAGEAIDILLDLRLQCSSDLERNPVQEVTTDELQEELAALAGADPGSS